MDAEQRLVLCPSERNSSRRELRQALAPRLGRGEAASTSSSCQLGLEPASSQELSAGRCDLHFRAQMGVMGDSHQGASCCQRVLALADDCPASAHAFSACSSPPTLNCTLSAATASGCVPLHPEPASESRVAEALQPSAGELTGVQSSGYRVLRYGQLDFFFSDREVIECGVDEEGSEEGSNPCTPDRWRPRVPVRPHADLVACSPNLSALPRCWRDERYSRSI